MYIYLTVITLAFSYTLWRIKKNFNIIRTAIFIFNILNKLTSAKKEFDYEYIGSDCILLKYTRDGKRYTLCLPFDHSSIPDMRDKKIYMVHDGIKHDITHEPGIKYIMSPEMFGAEHFEVHNVDTEEIEIFKGDSAIHK